MQASSTPIAAFVPPDAASILEIARLGDQPGLAAAVQSRNPGARVLGLRVKDAPPGRAFFADLTAQRGLFDTVVIQPGVAEGEALFALIGAAATVLRPHGCLLVHVAGPVSTTDLAAHGLVADQAARVGGAVVLRAVRADYPLDRMRIQFMTLRPSGGLNVVRIEEPRSFLATLPGVATDARIAGLHPDRTRGMHHKIAVMQRQIVAAAAAPTYRMMLDLGYLIISEFDDNPNFWPAMGANDYRTFRFVHAVQTSTDTLAERLRAWNPEVAVFPNQIATLPPPRVPRQDGRVVLFIGAFNRGVEWRELLEPLNRLLREFGDRVAVEVLVDQTFFDALDTGHKTFTPACDYPAYLQVLRRCDVALMPLLDTEFNRCKSDLKFIECAANGVACLASPVVYGASIEDGRTGLLFDDIAGFEERLRRLITDPALRGALAAEAYRYVHRERLLHRHYRSRYDWYRSLLARKDELDAALRERLAAWG